MPTEVERSQGPDLMVQAEPAEAERLRRRKVLLMTTILLVGLPIYILLASSIVSGLTITPQSIAEAGASGGGRNVHWSVELLIYLFLGVIWALPLRGLASGLGKAPKE